MRTITCEQTGQTFTQCDCCKRYNILLGKDDYMFVESKTYTMRGSPENRGGYLFCTDCAKKFYKMMEEFCNVEGSSV